MHSSSLLTYLTDIFNKRNYLCLDNQTCYVYSGFSDQHRYLKRNGILNPNSQERCAQNSLQFKMCDVYKLSIISNQFTEMMENLLPTSCMRSRARILSNVSSDGERPPCRQKICKMEFSVFVRYRQNRITNSYQCTTT